MLLHAHGTLVHHWHIGTEIAPRKSKMIYMSILLTSDSPPEVTDAVCSSTMPTKPDPLSVFIILKEEL